MCILELYVKYLKQSLGFLNLKVQKNYLQVNFKVIFRKPKKFFDNKIFKYGIGMFFKLPDKFTLFQRF
jgi:hypothetical protein